MKTESNVAEAREDNITGTIEARTSQIPFSLIWAQHWVQWRLPRY